MSQAGCFQSFQVCAIRATRVSATGTPLSGATDGYLSKAPTMVKLAPDNQAGVELTAENGCGFLCGYYKQPDQLKKYNINFELCDLDNELIELLTDNPIVTVGGQTVGQTSKRVGACATASRNGVVLEFWTKKWNACAPPTGDQYWHWTAPRAYLQTGEQTAENDFMKIPIEGYLQENPAFLNGSWDEGSGGQSWPSAAGTLTALWGVISTNEIPTASCGYVSPT
jgi:hypothetical protein